MYVLIGSVLEQEIDAYQKRINDTEALLFHLRAELAWRQAELVERSIQRFERKAAGQS